MYSLRLQRNLETGQLFFFISVKLAEKGSYTVISHMYGLRLQRNLETGQLFFFFSVKLVEKGSYTVISHMYGTASAAAQPRNWTTIFFSFSKAGGERLLHGDQSHVRPSAAAQPGHQGFPVSSSSFLSNSQRQTSALPILAAWRVGCLRIGEQKEPVSPLPARYSHTTPFTQWWQHFFYVY